MGRILNGDDWVWPIVLRQKGGHATQEAFARLVRQKVRRSDQRLTCTLARARSLSLALALALSFSRARSLSLSLLALSLSLARSLSFPCGCQRLVCIGRDRERACMSAEAAGHARKQHALASGGHLGNGHDILPFRSRRVRHPGHLQNLFSLARPPRGGVTRSVPLKSH